MVSDEILFVPQPEYEQLLDIKKKSAALKQTIRRLEQDLMFHAITASNLEKIRDVNEQQREEQYLYNTLLLKNCPGILFYLDLNLNFILGSEMGLDYMNHTSASAKQGMSFGGLLMGVFHNEDIEMLRSHCLYTLSNHEKSDKEYSFLRKDGGTVKMQVETAPAMDEGNECRGVTLVMRDITEISNEREKAVNASKAKSIFLANMSHDIRTPMNAIIGMSEVLLNEPLNENQKSYVNDIMTASLSLLDLINDILDLSKIEEGKLNIVSVEYNLPLLIENVNSMFRYSANQKGIEYHTVRRTEIPEYVVGDDVRVKQILTNIIGNAIKFTSKGSVSFEVHRDDDMLCFDVIDTGTGIHEDDIPKLFMPFYQLHEENHRYVQGSGLGLSITQNLVQLMKGTLNVDSVYGEGSTFRIRLPLESGTPAASARKTAPKAFSFIQAPDAQVLVVDDNAVNLKVAVRLLKLCGIEADTATNGMAAIDKIADKKYDIVFLDHMMPGMDGIQTTRQLRQTGYKPEDLIIIALSANALSGARQLFLDSGMQDFLVKPIDKNVLNEMLIKWLPPEKVLPQPEEMDSSEAFEKARLIQSIDIEQAIRAAKGSHRIFYENLALLRQNLPMIITALENQNIDVKRTIGIMRGLYRLLGSTGAVRLCDAAGKIQEKAQNGDIAGAKALMPQFVSDLQALNQECIGALVPQGEQEA